MPGITLNNSSLKRYIELFRNLDLSSKKKIIEGLEAFIDEEKTPANESLSSLFGAWQDNRDADEIIDDIKNTRINNPDIESF